MSKNHSTGHLAQARRKAAKRRGGTSKQRYERFLLQEKENHKIIELLQDAKK